MNGSLEAHGSLDAGGRAATLPYGGAPGLSADDVEEALDALSVLSSPQNTIVLFGDSITAQNSTITGDDGAGNHLWDSLGYWTWARIALRERMKWLANAGAGSNTTAQMLARITTDVIAYSPGWCVVQGGGNDVTTGRTASAIEADLTSIYSTLIAAGIRPIACTITPTTFINTTSEKQVWADVNAWIKDYAREHSQIVLCDWVPYLIDATNGGPDTTKFQNAAGDYVHPNNIGAYWMGYALAKALEPEVRFVDRLVTNNHDARNLLSNGLMTGDTAGLATGWTVTKTDGSASDTLVAKVPRRDNIQGEWQSVSLKSGDFMLWAQNTNVGTDWSVGQTAVARIEFEREDNWQTVKNFRLQLDFYNGVGSVYAPSVRSADGDIGVFPRTGVLETPPTVIPVGTTRLQLKLIGSTVSNVGNMTVRASRAEIRAA